jgi:hypothetical protein
MTKPNIFDGETNRPMSNAEYAQWQADNAEAQARVEAEAEALEAKAVARQALLTKLGITEQEAQLLLGS